MDYIRVVKETIEGDAQVLLSRIDEGLDDYENGRVISSEELWKEIDSI